MKVSPSPVRPGVLCRARCSISLESGETDCDQPEASEVHRASRGRQTRGSKRPDLSREGASDGFLSLGIHLTCAHMSHAMLNANICLQMPFTAGVLLRPFPIARTTPRLSHNERMTRLRFLQARR